VFYHGCQSAVVHILCNWRYINNLLTYFKFVKSVLYSSNNVLSGLANLCIGCFDFGRQLTLINVQMDMPIYVISQSLHQHFSVMCTA